MRYDHRRRGSRTHHPGPVQSLQWVVWAVILVLVLVQVVGVLVLDFTAA
jgi:hypothetical protein